MILAKISMGCCEGLCVTCIRGGWCRRGSKLLHCCMEGSSGRSASTRKWKANMKVLGCEDAEWIEVA